MKNLVTFTFIIITFINVFNNFAFSSSSPAKWKRGIAFQEEKKSRDFITYYNYNHYLCSSGLAYCPIGSTCITGSNTCSISCTSGDVDCGDGTCCHAGEYCGSDGYCSTIFKRAGGKKGKKVTP